METSEQTNAARLREYEEVELGKYYTKGLLTGLSLSVGIYILTREGGGNELSLFFFYVAYGMKRLYEEKTRFDRCVDWAFGGCVALWFLVEVL